MYIILYDDWYSYIYILLQVNNINFFLILNLGKHPFLKENERMISFNKQLTGEFEKIKEGRYSLALINLMERMMDVV
jgi:hypothetical protein